jgi:hypothetical protein
VIARDFGFHGNSAGNRLLSFRDHGPGRDAAGTSRTERAHAGPVRRRGAPVSHLAAAARTPAMVIDAQGARELRGARHGSSGGPSSGRPLCGISCELDPVTAVAGAPRVSTRRLRSGPSGLLGRTDECARTLLARGPPHRGHPSPQRPPPSRTPVAPGPPPSRTAARPQRLPASNHQITRSIAT